MHYFSIFSTLCSGGNYFFTTYMIDSIYVLTFKASLKKVSVSKNIVEVEQRRIFFEWIVCGCGNVESMESISLFFKQREREIGIGGILPHTRYLHVNEVSLKIPNVMRRDLTRIDYQVSETTSEHLHFWDICIYYSK